MENWNSRWIIGIWFMLEGKTIFMFVPHRKFMKTKTALYMATLWKGIIMYTIETLFICEGSRANNVYRALNLCTYMNVGPRGEKIGPLGMPMFCL